MTAVDALATALSVLLDSRLLRRGTDGFEELAAVTYAGAATPALIARPRSTSEIAEIIARASDSGVPFAVRGQGHSFSRHGVVADGLMIDLRLLDALQVDPVHRIGTSGASTTTGAYTLAGAEYGLATGFGDHPEVGIPGLVLGGGFGYLSRRDGLTIDNLIDAQVVLADGSVVTASDDEHPELFWALRGGGGNFGVVTQLRMRLTPTPIVTGGLIAFEPHGDTVETLFEAARAAADDITLLINVMKTPPAPHFDEERHGTPIVTAHICHSGDPGTAERALAPFRAAGPIVLDRLHEQPYPDLFGLAADQKGTRTLRSTGFIGGFAADRAETAIELIASAPTAAAIVNLRPLGGAIARIPDDATAFAFRQRAGIASIRAIDRDSARADAGAAWVEEAAAALNVRGEGAVNFFGDRGARVTDAYPPPVLTRLRQIKARYDPSNRFRSNYNIEPL